MTPRGSVSRSTYRLTNLSCIVSLVLTAASCGGGDPVSPAGTPAVLQEVSGSGQSGAVGTQLGQDFVVRVNDASGNPVPGVVVTWAVTAGGGSMTPTNSTSGANGLAASRLTLGPTAGANTATATVSGLGSVTFTASATTGGGGGGGGPTTGTLAFRTIDAGSYHTCAITPSELAYCWGFNQDGELGTGNTTLSMVPTAVSGGLKFRQVSGGKYHSCGVTLAGDGYCWGSNLERQLASSADLIAVEPILNSKAITFGSISVGRSHSCGISLDGTAFCWGSNITGQLGYPTLTTSVDTAGFVGTSADFTRLAAGGLHNCGITTAGTTLCWGFNDKGQLGNGTTTGGTTVITTSGGFSFDSITAGFKHTCALTAAGAAYCWGDNAFGQLGDGTNTTGLVPVPVSGGLTFTSLSAGFYHTCGIATTGEAFCWGRNTPNSVQESTGGQLGDGTTASKSVPTLVTGGLAYRSVSAGEVTTCGVTTAGVAYCWGDNEYGQLGTGNTTSSTVPVKVSNQP